MDTLKIILLIMQIISCVALTIIVILQNGKAGGMSALTGGSSDTLMGKNKAATLDAKLARITKWVAAAFVLLTLFVSMLYTAA